MIEIDKDRKVTQTMDIESLNPFDILAKLDLPDLSPDQVRGVHSAVLI